MVGTVEDWQARRLTRSGCLPAHAREDAACAHAWLAAGEEVGWQPPVKRLLALNSRVQSQRSAWAWRQNAVLLGT